ncbi:MAG: hypothetical protein AB2L18_12645 [Anaerolineaceae bacterium]
MAADEAEAGGVAAYEAGEISGVAELSERDSIDLLAPLIDCVPFDVSLHCVDLLCRFSGFTIKSTSADKGLVSGYNEKSQKADTVRHITKLFL